MTDQTQQWTLVPESQCVDQDDYPDDEQIRRDIAGWEEEDAAWMRNERPARITIFMQDSRRIGPAEMTRAEYDQLRARAAVHQEPTATRSYDPDADTLYIRCSAEPILTTEEVAPGVLLDLDASGRVAGVEILDASQCLKPRRNEAA